MGTEHLNRRGRPKGSKNRLSEEFLSKLADDFEQHGVGVIQQVRITEPAAYLKIVASLQPKELQAEINDSRLQWLTDDELEEAIRILDAEISEAKMLEMKAKVKETLPIPVINTGVQRGPNSFMKALPTTSSDMTSDSHAVPQSAKTSFMDTYHTGFSLEDDSDDPLEP